MAPAKLAFTCDWHSADDAAKDVDTLTPKLEHVRIASATNYIPSRGAFTLLIFKTFVEKDNTPKDGAPQERLTYRALIVGEGSTPGSATELANGNTFKQSIVPAIVWSEQTTRGTGAAPGTDFKRDEQPENKTLLHLDSNIDRSGSSLWLWQRARFYVIGAAGITGDEPRVIGSFGTVIANQRLAAIIAFLACVVAYIAAAVGTFWAHKSQRVYDDDGNQIGTDGALPRNRPLGAAKPPVTPNVFDMVRSSAVNRLANVDKGHGFLIGTNYKTVWAHIFNPVVLSAGSNGLGSATNLQILFFSVIVFGVVSYIWMMTGHLTGLSTTVVLLMGISGIGATAAAGADVAKNRLSFDNWAWLINRGWLPPGGIAEVNAAKWKDIFTTNGTFDVYRFQMICFSVVVGFSLVAVGTQANDLSAFEIPQALLGILGLSQVVYVAGKLVAAPSISDLDKQIDKLQATEKNLRELNDRANSTSAGASVVTWAMNSSLLDAQKTYSTYLDLWDETKTMFQTTIGYLVPDSAAGKRPPFELSDVILNRLPDASIANNYQQTLILSGKPAQGSYQWSLDAGAFPSGMTITAAANNIDAVLSLPAGGNSGEYQFTLRVVGPDPAQTITRDFALHVL